MDIRDENRRLKRFVADLTLGKRIDFQYGGIKMPFYKVVQRGVHTWRLTSAVGGAILIPR